MNLLERGKKVYEANQRLVDYAVAMLAFVVVLVVIEMRWGRQNFVHSIYGTRQALYGAIVAVGGSMLGFILAAATIVLAVVQTPRFESIRSSRHYVKIFTVWFEAVYVLALTTVWGFLGLLTDTDSNPKWLVSYAMIFLVFLSANRVYRAVWLLKRISLIAAKPIPPPPPEAMGRVQPAD